MTDVLTAAQMRALEAAAIASGDLTGLELMERAGCCVVEAIFAEWPALRGAKGGGAAPLPSSLEPMAQPRQPPGYLGQDEESAWRAAVLCGPGNNGGDGFVVARLLKEAGWLVEVFLYGTPEGMPPDARVNYERWCGMGEISALMPPLALNGKARPDLMIDALFGTGLSRAMPNDLELCLNEFNAMWPAGSLWRVSVDLVSGLCADSGKYVEKPDLGTVFHASKPAAAADIVVTFHSLKRGHLLASGPELSGKLVVCDIGLPAFPVRGAVQTATPQTRALMKGGDDKSTAHKYSHGHALVLSGGVATGGAARLAVRGALRIGAGVVSVGCPPGAVMVNAAQLNAVMVKPIGDAAGLWALLEDARINALCVGPGLGLGAREAGLVAAALQSTRAVVLDADALTLLARDAALFGLLHEGCVLTPHAGEFARLFPDIAARLNAPATKGPAYSKVDATRDAAKQAGCVVLFKGPDTVIAAPDGRCRVNAAVYDRSAPWLATAGSGDVLAGFITGLLARGFDPMQAAKTGAWLHVECARSFGPGLIAEDLPEELPKVFRQLGL